MDVTISSKSGVKEKKHRRIKIQYFDYSLFVLVVLLLIFGMVMLYSVSSYTGFREYGDAAYFLKKQATASLLGIAALLVLSQLDYRIFKHLAGLAYLVSIVLCTIVIFSGANINGSTRWLYIGKISIQPSEIAKVGIIIFLAAVIQKRTSALNTTANIIKIFIMMLPLMAVVAYTNLSTGIIIGGISFTMLFVASKNKLAFAGIIGIGALFVWLFINAAGYRSERIAIWQHPEDFEKGYQTLQGLYAIGSGGLFGKGLGESMQKRFVPEAPNDMIFSVVCEELGIFGAICIILLYILLLWRFVVIAINAKDLFGTYLVVGVMAHIALQVSLNIAVVTNTIPNTGITLPFFSYGGTSIAILLAEMGLVLSVSRGIELK